MTELAGLNRQQRRQLEKKLEQKEPPSLAEWLSSPDKLVKRGELWNVLKRWEMIQELKERYYSLPARIGRFLRRINPWMEDPPPNPFETASPEEADEGKRWSG